MTFLLTLVALSLAGAFVSGLVGVGGAIVMRMQRAPASLTAGSYAS